MYFLFSKKKKSPRTPHLLGGLLGGGVWGGGGGGGGGGLLGGGCFGGGGFVGWVWGGGGGFWGREGGDFGAENKNPLQAATRLRERGLNYADQGRPVAPWKKQGPGNRAGDKPLGGKQGYSPLSYPSYLGGGKD